MTPPRRRAWMLVPMIAASLAWPCALLAQPENEPPPPPPGDMNGEPGDRPPPPGDDNNPDGRRPRLDRFRQVGPGGPGGGMGQPGGLFDRPIDERPGVFREVLVRFRERLQVAVDKLNEGVAALDRGDEPSKVRQELEQAGRDLRQAFAQLGGGGGYGPQGQGGPGGPGGPDGLGGPGGPGGFDQPGMGGGMGGRPPRGPLNAEDRDRVLALIKEHRPTLIARLDELAKNDPAAKDRIIGSLIGRVREWKDVRDADPEMFKIRGDELENLVSVMSTVSKIAAAKRENADDARLAPLRDELKTLMGAQFDLRLQMQNKQLADMKSRAERFQKNLDKQAEDRQGIIDEKTAEVLRNAERQPPPHPPGGPGQGGGGGEPKPRRPQ